LDWAELPVAEPNCLSNLRYLYALQRATDLANQLGNVGDARRWKRWGGQLSLAIGKMFLRHRQWYDTAAGTSRSQHVGSFLVLTNQVSRAEANDLMDEAVSCSLDTEAGQGEGRREEDRGGTQSAGLVLMSPYMHYYLFEALEQLGRGRDILTVISARWNRWLEQGAKTTWENWEIDFADGSQCHGWSAHPLLYLIRHGNLSSRVQE
jgi:hypothetical protein